MQGKNLKNSSDEFWSTLVSNFPSSAYKVTSSKSAQHRKPTSIVNPRVIKNQFHEFTKWMNFTYLCKTFIVSG